MSCISEEKKEILTKLKLFYSQLFTIRWTIVISLALHDEIAFHNLRKVVYFARVYSERVSIKNLD